MVRSMKTVDLNDVSEDIMDIDEITTAKLRAKAKHITNDLHK